MKKGEYTADSLASDTEMMQRLNIVLPDGITLNMLPYLPSGDSVFSISKEVGVSASEW